MFLFFIVQCFCENKFCYRPVSSTKYPECPQNTVLINSVEEIRNNITENAKNITLYVHNDRAHTFSVDNNFTTNIPIYIYGPSTTSEIELKLIKHNPQNRVISLDKITVSVETNNYPLEFNQLTLKNVRIRNDQSSEIEIFSSKLKSDAYSLQYCTKVTAKDVSISFSSTIDKTTPINLNFVESVTSLNIEDISTDTKVWIQDKYLSMTYQGSKIPYFVAEMGSEANNLIVYCEVSNGLKMEVGSDPYINSILFEPSISGMSSVLTMKENTASLSTGRSLIMNGGTAVFEDSNYLYKVVCKESVESTIKFKSSLSFESLSFNKHTLNIRDTDDNAVLIVNDIRVYKASTIKSDKEISIQGNSITFSYEGEITTTNVKFQGFTEITASSNTQSRLSSLTNPSTSGNPVTVKIPILFGEQSGKLLVDKFTNNNNKLNIVLTHKAAGSESSSDYDELVNKEITLFHSDSDINCDNFNITVDNSQDPWSSSLLFTQERIIFEPICTTNDIKMKILENPINVYETLVYADDWTITKPDIQPIDTSTFDWVKYVTKYTKGITLMLHSNVPSTQVFNILDIQNEDSTIELRIINSDYSGAVSNPTVSINSDSLETKCSSISIDDCIVTFTSSSSKPVIKVPTFIATGKASFPVEFDLKSTTIGLQDSLVKQFSSISSGTKLTVYPTERNFEVSFRDDGWILQSTTASAKIPKSLELTIKVNKEEGYRVNLTLDSKCTTPTTLTLIHNGNRPTIILDQNFEKFKSMPPITVQTKQPSVSLTYNGKYIPIIFTNSFELTLGTSTQNIETIFADQTYFHGSSSVFKFNDAPRVGKVTIDKFIIRDPSDNSQKTSLTAHSKVHFNEIRSMPTEQSNLSTINAGKVVIDSTHSSNIADSNITELVIQGELSVTNFPTISLSNINISSILIDIAQPSVQSLPAFSIPIINAADESVDLIDLKGKIQLSREIIKIGNSQMYVSTAVGQSGIFLILSAYTPETPSQTPTPTILMPTATPYSHDSQSEGENTTIAISIGVVCIIAVVIIGIGVFIYYKKKPATENDYLTVSSDYLVQDTLKV